MLPPTRSPGIGQPVSPSIGTTARENYTTSTPGLQRHTIPSVLSRQPHYGQIPDTTPRNLNTATMTAPLQAYGNVTSMNYQHERAPETPPFESMESLHDIYCDSHLVQPHIDCKIEKGFFYSSDRTWTCYRRNYFSVQCSYSLNPHTPNGRLYLHRTDKKSGTQPEMIQALALSLSAVVDGTAGKSIELVQHTPKRDKGPQMQIGKEKVPPTPPNKPGTDHNYAMTAYHSPNQVASVYLPLQNEADPSSQSHGFSSPSHNGTTYQHTFERIQFKSATANNGKRRAQQQYYHLIVELWADVRGSRDPSPHWVKVAQRASAQVVVRGRSPSHYQNEGPHTPSRPSLGGAGGGSGGHPSIGGLGYLGRPLGSMLGGTTLGGGRYNGTQYSLNPSPIGSHSVSSASSVSGDAMHGIVGDSGCVDENGEVKIVDSDNGYTYFPGAIYEAGLHPPPLKLEAAAGTLDDRRIKDEYAHQQGSYSAGYQAGRCGQFQGMESSKGFYPDLHAGTGY
jgi:meiosis-specific transcription factor NDT80